jgi:chromosome segregation ATPase
VITVFIFFGSSIFLLFGPLQSWAMEARNFAVTPFFSPQLVPRSQFLAIIADSQRLKDQIRAKSDEIEILRSDLSSAHAEVSAKDENLKAAQAEIMQMRLVVRGIVPNDHLEDLRSRLEIAEIAAADINDKCQEFTRTVQENMVSRKDLNDSRF